MNARVEKEEGLTPEEVRDVFVKLQAQARPGARAIERAEVCRAIVEKRLLSADQSDGFAAYGLKDFVRRALTAKMADGVFFTQPVKRPDGRIGFFQPAFMDIDDARGWVGAKNAETMADRKSILPTYRMLAERFGDELPPLVKIDGD